MTAFLTAAGAVTAFRWLRWMGTPAGPAARELPVTPDIGRDASRGRDTGLRKHDSVRRPARA